MKVSLIERQRDWMRGIVGPNIAESGKSRADTASAAWEGGARSSAQGFAVYVNNVRATLRQSMLATFPLSLAGAGSETFDRATVTMLEVTPPENGDLGEYGSQLPEYLASAGASHRCCEIARCEWLVDQLPRQQVERAWRLEEAALLSPEAWLSLELHLVAQAAVVKTDIDLAAVFASNYEDIITDCKHQRFFCVVASNDGVSVAPIHAHAYALALHIDGQSSLEVAIEPLIVSEPDFDLFSGIATLIGLRAIAFPLTMSGSA